MGSGAVHASADQGNIRQESRCQPNWNLILPLAAKITLVVLVILALAAATYFSFGAALPLIGAGINTVPSLFALVGGFSFGLAAATAPIGAAVNSMHRVTDHNLSDSLKFLRFVSFMLVVGLAAHIYSHFKGGG